MLTSTPGSWKKKREINLFRKVTRLATIFSTLRRGNY